MDLNNTFIPLAINYGQKIIGALLLFLIGRWLMGILLNIFEKRSRDKIDPTLFPFINSILKVIFYLLLLITVASTLGIEMTSFIAVLGAAGLAVGLALQGSLANFAGGVLILTFRPFDVGNFIETNEHKGKVVAIKILYTTLLTRDNKKVVIPNGKLSNNSIINYSTEENRRVDLNFGISYEDNILKVKQILTYIVDQHKMILDEPEPIIRVGEHADSAVIFNVLVWTKAENYWDVYYDMMEQVKIVFDKQDISIPYPQMDVHMDK